RHYRAAYSTMSASRAARLLGWFSIALGLVELVTPGTLKRKIGIPGPKGVVSAFGLREIGAGVGILRSDRPVRMVWGRVAGDLADLFTLMPAMARSNPNRATASAALAFVLAATAVDLYVALQGDDGDE
ncbi:MAG TPA: cyclase dehydrase, partial [Tianweitania sediminis]|nr:cyclase dehydrase [Tianweitania sediminis]